MPAPELRPASLRAVMDDILWLNREQCSARGIGLGWTRNLAAGTSGGAIDVALEDRGERIVLSIADSGGQLGAVPAARLFTPFFSTRKGGQGIGLMFVREVTVAPQILFVIHLITKSNCFLILFTLLPA